MSLLEINDLHVSYAMPHDRKVQAVKGASLAVERGESVGLVGESGCGKSTLASAVLRLVPSERGLILYNDVDVLGLRGRELFEYRAKMQMVFQDPYGSLNPRLSVGSALEECLAVHNIRLGGAFLAELPGRHELGSGTGGQEGAAWVGRRNERRGMVAELLTTVGLEAAHAARYPHEFSGGQRQRIGIARALAVNPEFIIADEPVSALDVSIQAQILNLLKDIQENKNFSILFIAHDLAVVRYMCSRIYVMYLGEIMESGATEDVYKCPSHPYTRALLAAVPDLDRVRRKRHAHSEAAGETPSLSTVVSGCPFHPRCPFAKPICKEEAPETKKVADGHFSRCHFFSP